jgi:hypothetical protein
MKFKRILFLILCWMAIGGLIFPVLTRFRPAQAQAPDRWWSSPFRLSNEQNKASEATLVADPYGYVHALWAETLDDTRNLIMYARFDGQTWSIPIDLYISGPFTSIGNISAVVDKDGLLQVVWSQGIAGPSFYTHAPANNATSAQFWEKPRVILIPSDRVQLQIDSKGVMHILYVRFAGENPGIYYTRSKDQGATWSTDIYLDPDILPDFGPRSLVFKIDETDGLHASWYYVPQNTIGAGDWVRYIHSLDGGDTWSKPFTMVKDDSQSGALQSPGPVMAVHGKTVLIIWAAGGDFLVRYYRYSKDSGQTWSAPLRFFDDLNGQAFEGLTVDGDGNFHYFAQVRFPQGIYHGIWNQEQWTSPAMIYLIRSNSDEPMGTKVHAHYTLGVVRLGNQLVLTFTDPPPEPKRKLFAMYRTLNNVGVIAPMPTPTPTPTPTEIPEETPTPVPTVSPLSLTANPELAPVVDIPSPTSSIWSGSIVTIVLLLGTVFYAVYYKNGRKK